MMKKALPILMTLNLLSTAALADIPQALQGDYETGVSYYRNGQYDKSTKLFKDLAKSAPDNQEILYYYAISLAQMGKFKEARETYQTVIRVNPASEAAKLAGKGIEYLPPLDKLDSPPQFQAPQAAAQKPAAQPDPSNYVQSNVFPGVQPQQNAQPQQTPFGTMDPQMLQAMMLLGSMGGGGGGGGGFNPMMMSLLQGQMGAGKPGEQRPGISPQVLSTMMMNQMMQDFSPFSSGKND